jgi:hypothetical protein
MVPGVLETPPVPVTELLGSLLGLSHVGGHWRGERRGGESLGNALLLAPVLGELPVFDQQIKTGAASVGLLVRPFVHAQLAIDEDFLALLNEVPEILGGLTPYLEVHKSGDLFFFPPERRCSARCWRSRQRQPLYHSECIGVRDLR